MSTRPSTDQPEPGTTKVSVLDLRQIKAGAGKIPVVTAYDAPSARLAEAAGIDVVLVGDSAGTTVFGHSSTVSVTLDEMLMLTRAVGRGVRRAMIVGDMPFGSFQVSNARAVRNAVRFVAEGGADAVKLEGAGRSVSRAAAIVDAGVPVMGHIGLTPQSAAALGGYKAQGRTADKAHRLYEDALKLEQAGCFALVLEAIPAAVAARITAALSIPTIGIGAGAGCDGQVLVWHDLLGLSAAPVPRFVKQYASLADLIVSALKAYADDVRAARFPESRHTYGMPDEELQAFHSRIR